MSPVVVAMALIMGTPTMAAADNRDHNEHRDCENNSGECSDDDQVVVAPVICAVPDSCQFG